MNHYESNYKENVVYKLYKDDTLSDAWIAGHLADTLRNPSVRAKYSKEELIEILWNLEQLTLKQCDCAQLGYRLKEIQGRKEGR